VTELTEKQADLCESSTTDYSDLKAFFINCTLKRGPEASHTPIFLNPTPGYPAYPQGGSVAVQPNQANMGGVSFDVTPSRGDTMFQA